MRKLLSILLTALSALFCVVACSAWLLSYHYSVGAYGTRGAHHYEGMLNRGQVTLIRFSRWDRPFNSQIVYGDPYPPPGPGDNPFGIGWNADTHKRFAGFEWAAGSYWPPMAWQFRRRPTFQRCGIPCWFIVVISAPLPAACIMRLLRRRRRIRRGLCLRCGYNLRATPDRCPECGIPASQP
jgi:hypothetical protein